MSERTWWESVKVEGGQAIDKVREVVREGNVRRIVVRQGDRTVAEFPLTVGVVGAVFAPTLAAVGAIVALTTDCSIDIQRTGPSPAAPPPPSPADDAPGPTSAPPDEPGQSPTV